MIINGESVDLVSYHPIYDDGIEWRNVGMAWVPRVRSANGKKFGSQVTIRAPLDYIMGVVFQWSRTTTLTVSSTLREPFLGPEIDYSGSWTMMVDPGSLSDIPTDTTNLGDRVELDMTMLIMDSDFWPANARDALDDSFPSSGLRILSVANPPTSKSKRIDLLAGRDMARIYEPNKAVIRYEGSRDTVAQLRKYLIGLGETPFTLHTPNARCWIFGVNGTSHLAYCMGIDDQGPSDPSCQKWTIDVTYGEADQ